MGSGVPLEPNVGLRTNCSAVYKSLQPKHVVSCKVQPLFSNVICVFSLISSHLSKGDRLKYLPAVADVESERVFL